MASIPCNDTCSPDWEDEPPTRHLDPDDDGFWADDPTCDRDAPDEDRDWADAPTRTTEAPTDRGFWLDVQTRNLDDADERNGSRTVDAFDDADDTDAHRNLDAFDDGEDTYEYRNVDTVDDGAFWADAAPRNLDALDAETEWLARRNRSAATGVLYMLSTTYQNLWESLREALAKERGSDKDPGPDDMSWPITVPRTTNSDVVQLATYWTQALTRIELMRAHGLLISDFGLEGVKRRWGTALDDVSDFALDDRADAVYVRNAAFWRATAYLAVALSTIDELPTPTFAAVRLDPDSRRNGVEGDAHLRVSANTYDEMWSAQKAALVTQRGSDLRQTPPPGFSGGPLQVPRTTNADILQLAGYWSRALEALDKKRKGTTNFLGLFPVPNLLKTPSLDAQIARWNAALADVEKYAKGSPPGDLYAKNEEFWRTAATLSTTIAVIDEQPPATDMMVESLKVGVGALPDTLKGAASAVASAAGAVAKAVGNVAREAGAGLFGGFGVPLLIGGGVLVGALLLSRRGNHLEAA